MSAERQLEICNMALSHLATGKEIQNLETDQSEEAATCRRFYKRALRRCQREYPFPVFTRYATLALVAENPNAEYAYSYRVPVDCAIPLKIPSGYRVDTRTSQVHFSLGSDDQGKLLYTDAQEATLKYSAFSEDTRLFDADFEMAFSLLLAFYIAPRITAGDANRLGRRAFEAYQIEGERAKARAANDETTEMEGTCEMIAARD